MPSNRGGLPLIGVALAAVVAVGVTLLVGGAPAPSALAPAARAGQNAQHAGHRAAQAGAPHRAARQGAKRPAAAWVRVSVATVWGRPRLVRPVDRPAVAAHPDVTRWIERQTLDQRLALDQRVLTQTVLGDRVEVLRQHSGWSRVRLPAQRGSGFPRGIVGWVPTTQVTRTPPGPDTVTVTDPRVPMRATTGGAVMEASYGSRLGLLASHAGSVVVSAPGARSFVVPRSAVAAGPTLRTGAAVVAAARQFLGVPYLWGGMSGFGIDCSGLTYQVYRQAGITLPRDAADQSRLGRPVPRAGLRPGDLVFFGPGDWTTIHHVGIYAGYGLVLHAPHAGSVVQLTPLTSWSDYWGARRYL